MTGKGCTPRKFRGSLGTYELQMQFPSWLVALQAPSTPSPLPPSSLIAQGGAKPHQLSDGSTASVLATLPLPFWHPTQEGKKSRNARNEGKWASRRLLTFEPFLRNQNGFIGRMDRYPLKDVKFSREHRFEPKVVVAQDRPRRDKH